MKANTPQYSPKQIAKALGASESSVKRWCDQKAIPTIRTVGGHRKITLDGVWQFLSVSGGELINPEVLGLPKSGENADEKSANSVEFPTQAVFREAMILGDEETCRQILQDRVTAGWRRSEALEFYVADAMQEIGDAWDCDRLDIYQERRSCDISIRLINELRMGVPRLPKNAPTAIGGAPAGDYYQLPTALVELALRESGWKAVSLGNNLPMDSFIAAAKEYQPQLVWMSVSHIKDVDQFVISQKKLVEGLGEDVTMVIGGRALTDDIRPRLKYSAFCDSLKHLTELVERVGRGFH